MKYKYFSSIVKFKIILYTKKKDIFLYVTGATWRTMGEHIEYKPRAWANT